MTKVKAEKALVALVKEVAASLKARRRPTDPLTAWLRAVEDANANLTAAFEHRGAPELLDHVYVELSLTDRELEHGLHANLRSPR